MKMGRVISLLTACAMLSAACGGAAGPQIAKSSASRSAAPDVSATDMAALVAGNNAFAFDLYRTLPGRGTNAAFSPFSVSLAMAMTYAGARGDTESQMATAMHFDLPQNRLHPAYNALDLELEKNNDSSEVDQQPLQLNIANSIWAEQTYTFLPEFLDTLAVNYGAGVYLQDFVNAAEPSRKNINAWVADRTNDKIKDLIPQGLIDSFTRIVLVNAIYFKADWLDQFDRDSTIEMSFHRLDGSQISTPTMNQGMHTPYASGDGWQAVELAYAGETAAMDLLVPDQGNFEQFDAALDLETTTTILASLEPAAVQLSLPKFEFTSQLGLSDQLSALGMVDAFDPDRADLSGMSGTRDLYVSAVVHKAFVAVDEKGTEAAAATAVIVGATGAPLFDVVLAIDRPFIFIIRDLNTGQILFLGRVTDPSAK